MKSLVDITLGYPMSAPFGTDPYDLLSLLRRHREPMRIYFHIRCVFVDIGSIFGVCLSRRSAPKRSECPMG